MIPAHLWSRIIFSTDADEAANPIYVSWDSHPDDKMRAEQLFEDIYSTPASVGPIERM